jgi:hypothetical protein
MIFSSYLISDLLRENDKLLFPSFLVQTIHAVQPTCFKCSGNTNGKPVSSGLESTNFSVDSGDISRPS